MKEYKALSVQRKRELVYVELIGFDFESNIDTLVKLLQELNRDRNCYMDAICTKYELTRCNFTGESSVNLLQDGRNGKFELQHISYNLQDTDYKGILHSLEDCRYLGLFFVNKNIRWTDFLNTHRRTNIDKMLHIDGIDACFAMGNNDGEYLYIKDKAYEECIIEDFVKRAKEEGFLVKVRRQDILE